MASISSRLERLECAIPADDVAILELQPDGSWMLIHAGRRQKRSVHKTVEDARRNINPKATLIIIDV